MLIQQFLLQKGKQLNWGLVWPNIKPLIVDGRVTGTRIDHHFSCSLYIVFGMPHLFHSLIFLDFGSCKRKFRLSFLFSSLGIHHQSIQHNSINFLTACRGIYTNSTDQSNVYECFSPYRTSSTGGLRSE